MISADQILAHLIGDYLLQSDWQALNKTSRSFHAAVHAVTYALPFLFFRPSWLAFAFIVVTHFVIDRWRLARYVVWAKNWIALPKFESEFVNTATIRYWIRRANPKFSECAKTGYAPDRPDWLAFWLLIIADNSIHLLLNGVALKWL